MSNNGDEKRKMTIDLPAAVTDIQVGQNEAGTRVAMALNPPRKYLEFTAEEALGISKAFRKAAKDVMRGHGHK